MRILLDECVPRKLRGELPGHDVKTVAEMGWAGTKNGVLLQRAAAEFEVLLTVDQGLPYQQNLAGLPFAVVIIKAPSNDINDLRPKMPKVLQVLATIQLGQVVQIDA
jgi:predicted nuclease of predicted toxin-antitoxin system